MIMLAADESQAIRGYAVDACDFAVKPLDYEGFKSKLAHALWRCNNTLDDVISVRTADGTVKMRVPSVCYVEVIRHELIFHTTRGTVLSRGTMKSVEQTLKGFGFARANHCYLVNLKWVDKIIKDIVQVRGVALKISRGKKAELENAFARFVEAQSAI